MRRGKEKKRRDESLVDTHQSENLSHDSRRSGGRGRFANGCRYQQGCADTEWKEGGVFDLLYEYRSSRGQLETYK